MDDEKAIHDPNPIAINFELLLDCCPIIVVPALDDFTMFSD